MRMSPRHLPMTSSRAGIGAAGRLPTALPGRRRSASRHLCTNSCVKAFHLARTCSAAAFPGDMRRGLLHSRRNPQLETTTMRRSIKIIIPLVALAAPVWALAQSGQAEMAARIDASSTAGAGEPSLAEVRAATERFRDVNQALAEGYLRDPANMCDDAPMMGKPAELGAMGIHFFRPDMLGISAPPNPRVDGVGTHTDFSKPSVLIYEPQADGSLELVAVENLVFIKAWEAAGNTEPPTFHGVAWDRMVD